MLNLLWIFLLSEETIAQSISVDEYSFTYLLGQFHNYQDAISKCRDQLQRDIFFVRREGVTELLVDWLADMDKHNNATYAIPGISIHATKLYIL